ncbi:MAG: DEAD/DEAH box helicase [Candidatus Cloacimonetes bacterium]|jgi:SNF2 family DNA or RNA helicase|nr:DEAD/DEAH box helicase [Candidatus Cloacimonadota bacterium]MDY0337235.1 DEAD/DEAH box helicase [Candidatus Cloacimonadaceae bacterium]MDD2544349.1 DEAD/DEAH box helicase [Candidatus Cloacimonadota bacterium]MDD2683822.1 DEAD/DEAH box helicase [Candidatus Cloacimonadota bacterium]MDD4034155.1 DEAD/DEAH box helicase [Candidatus Cloacimonadota bacterium]
MARLFSKDYHELSNSWYFNHAVIPLAKDDLWYWLAADETGRFQMRFFPSQTKTEYFSAWVEVLYDPETERVVNHKCAECNHDDNCRHYLSLLRYCYFNLSTDIFTEDPIKTCDGNALRANPHWMDLAHEAKLSVEGIYDPDSDKVRFHHDAFRDLNMQELIKIIKGQDTEAQELQANYQVLDDYELRLFSFLNENRAAYSAKSCFWSIYKKDFPAALSYMEPLSGRIIIRETGELLNFAAVPYPLALRIEQRGKQNYALSPVLVDELSTWFAGYPTWLFFRNKVHKAYLPFRSEVVDQIFNSEMLLSAQDLIYYRSIVHNELLRKDIYLDFDPGIQLPPIIDSLPRCSLQIKSLGDKILIEGFLVYDQIHSIPLSLLRFGKPLVYCPLNPEESDYAWFLIPHQIFSQVRGLLDELPPVELNLWEQNAQLVFPESSFEDLQSAIFKLSDEEWDIVISDELNNRFITKIPLEVEIQAVRSEEIDWFSYQVSYHYRDLRFTHEELKKYFRSGEQLLHTVDGRIFFISNPQILDEVEKLISHSEEQHDGVYRARVMNLPYYQRLREENPTLRMLGDEHLENMFRDLINRQLERKQDLPYFLQTVLRGYQKAGVAWISMLSHYHLNGILADEMGLGKTIQALTIILSAPQDSTSMVICPKTLLYNWAAEIEKFHTNIPFAIVEGNKAERSELLHSPNIRLYIISYSMVLSDLSILRDLNFEWIVLDEAQNIKNVSAQRTSAIKKLKSRHRLALSGTPIENKITELWSIMDFLMPGYLGSLKRFKSQYLSPDDEQLAQKSLHRAVSPFLLRRVKHEVLMELPDKQEQVSWCKMSPLQEKLYLQIIDTVQKKMLPESADQITYVHILAALTKLRQVCNHPHLANSDVLPDLELSAKLEMLVELVQEAIAGGHKVLVFSQFVQMLSIIKRNFNALDIPFCYLDGHTRDRQSQINEFENNPNIRLFLISLKTGGTGLNLTSADTVILYDPWWNPMVENQAIDRTHRLGQTRKVQVYRLITKNTVEEKILSLQKNKIDLFNEVIEGGSTMLKTMNLDELKSLFSYE